MREAVFSKPRWSAGPSSVLAPGLVCALSALAFALTALAFALTALAPSAASAATVPSGIHKIKHVVIIMQENRSFDTYFGTYPGADGIPGLAGHPGKVPCIPDPHARGCQRPYHTTQRHQRRAARTWRSMPLTDIDGGKMDGFIAQRRVRAPRHRLRVGCADSAAARPANCVDVMGYHDQRELPQLLDVRAATSCSRTTCSSPPVLEPPVAPVHGLGVVGAAAPTRSTR